MVFRNRMRPDPEPLPAHDLPADGRAAVIPIGRHGSASAREKSGPSAGWGVSSELGRLRRVIVHRPGPELRRLTPENKEWLLFDDVVWAERAEQEHDAFADVLRQHGAEVLYVEDLLSDVLGMSQPRDEVLQETLQAAALGPTLENELESWLAALPAAELARYLIGGITYGELPFASGSLLAQASGRDEFVLAPLPNQMFTRDSSTWLPQGVLLHTMASPARVRETIYLKAIYRHHPVFRRGLQDMLTDGIPPIAAVEGGDVLVLGNATLMIGMGERTTPVGIELYAARLFEAQLVKRVIAVGLPRRRSSIHLDTVLTMVDHDTFVIHQPIQSELTAYVLDPGPRGVRARPAADLVAAMTDALGSTPRLIRGASDPAVAEREQWDEGANLLALAPGLVVAYERNTYANERLREHGMEVLTVPGSELARGRGGPRCLTCPVARDPM